MRNRSGKHTEEANARYPRHSFRAKIPLLVLATAITGSLLPVNVLAFETESPETEFVRLVAESQKQAAIEKEEAKTLLFQAPEATALTVEGETALKEHYVEKYMPVEGCSLIEELPVTSNIDYVAPQPKAKPAPKLAPAVAPRIETVPKAEAPGKAKPTANSPTIAMTADERYWLEKLVEAESAGESYEGKVAVASIIANRVELKEFPNSVMAVIKAPKQFSPFMDGSIHRRTPSAETIQAVAQVFDEGNRNISQDTAFFCTTAIAPYSWISKNKPFVKTIGNHNFYLK